MSNVFENGAEAALLASFIFSIGFRDCTRWTNVYKYWCVCFVTCPTYEVGILQLGEQHVNKKYLKAI